MPIPKIPVSIVVIAENEPVVFATGNVDLRKLLPEYYLWIHPFTGDYKRWNPDTEAWDLLPPQSHHSHHEKNGDDEISQLGTVHFQGAVYAGASNDYQGITQNIELSNGTLQIKKGIVFGWIPSIPP